MQDLKRSHWMVIGLSLGLLLGAVRVIWPIEPLGTNIKQDQFERFLVSQDPNGGPALTRMVIHPRAGQDIVTAMVRRDVLRGKINPRTSGGPLLAVRFLAERPYYPVDALDGEAAARDTVRDYLDHRANRATPISYGVAWWERPWVIVGGWTLGATVVIGGAWPVVLGFLLGAGLSRRELTAPSRANRRVAISLLPGSPKLTLAELYYLVDLVNSIEAALVAVAGESQADHAVPEAPHPADTFVQRRPEDRKAVETPEPDTAFGCREDDLYPTELGAIAGRVLVSSVEAREMNELFKRPDPKKDPKEG